MNSNQDSLHTLNEIRDLMERSSKFLSLSGLSGVFAGIFALIGAGAAYVRFKTDWLTDFVVFPGNYEGYSREELVRFLFIDGLLILSFSLVVCIILTVRKGRRKGLTLWNSSSRRLLVSMAIPLATGGIFCVAMAHYGLIWMLFPCSLIFYGMALLNASRFTFREVFYLGVFEVALGCISLFLTSFSLIFWAIGFGLLHIGYGLTMYNRYDRVLPKKGAGVLMIAFLVFFSINQGQAQIVQDSSMNAVTRFYDRETIYMRGGNSFVKNNVIYTGRRALEKEFLVSSQGMDLYMRSRRLRGISLVISLAGSAGSIISLISGNRDNLRTFFWVSLGTGVVSGAMNIQANNLRDQAVWTRNRDAMSFMQAGQ